MEPVTNKEGQRGFYDEATGFIPVDSMQKVTNPEGQRGYYHEKAGFIPAPDSGINKPSAQAEPQRNMFGGRSTVANTLDLAKGILETPLSIATGIPASMLGLGAGIASTAIKGDEAGKKTREDVTRMFTYQPTSESGQGAMDVLGTLASPLAIPRAIGTALGGEQYGNVADVVMMGLIPKLPQVARQVANVPYKAAEFLYRKNLAPTGNVAETQALTEFGLNKNYAVTSKGWTKFQNELNVIDRRAKQILASNPTATAPLSKVLEPLDKTINQYAKMGTERPLTNMRALQRMKKEIEAVWMEKYPDGNVPINELQNFKTMLYSRGQNAYGELQKAMTTEGRKAVAHGAMEQIENVFPELGAVNRQMKPYLEFKDHLSDAIVRLKNEKFSITNTIFNNNYLLGKLSQIFRAMSPKTPLSDVKNIAVRLKTASTPVIDFDEAFAPARPNPNQIEYKPQINLGMTDVSGQPSGYTPPLPRPTTKAIGYERSTTPINLGMLDESSVKSVRGVYNNPAFWKQNQDLTNLRLKMKNNKTISTDEWNTLLYRVTLNRMGSQINPRIPEKTIPTSSLPTGEQFSLTSGLIAPTKVKPTQKDMFGVSGEFPIKGGLPSKEIGETPLERATREATERSFVEKHQLGIPITEGNMTLEERVNLLKRTGQKGAASKLTKSQPQNIITWIKSKGGIDYKKEFWNGELDMAMENQPSLKSALNKRSGKGLTLDELASMAKAEGWITEADPNILLNAINKKKISQDIIENRMSRGKFGQQ